MRHLFKLSWKKSFLIILFIPFGLLGLVLLLPQILINQKNLEWLISRKEVTETISWEIFDVNVRSSHFLEKSIQIKSRDFCAQLNKNIIDMDFCLKNLDLNFILSPIQWPFIKTPEASFIEFEKLKINTWPTAKNETPKGPPQSLALSKSWKDFWKLPLPSLVVKIPHIILPNNDLIKRLDLVLELREDMLNLEVLGANLKAQKKGLGLSLSEWSPEKYVNNPKISGITIQNFNLSIQMLSKSVNIESHLQLFSSRLNFKTKLPSEINSSLHESTEDMHDLLGHTTLSFQIEDVNKLLKSLPKELVPNNVAMILENLSGNSETQLKFKKDNEQVKAFLHSQSDLELNRKTLTLEINSTPSLRWKWPLELQENLERILVSTNADLHLKSIKTHLSSELKNQWDQLPSPLNNFNGPVHVQFKAKKLSSELVNLNIQTNINLSHADQKLHIVTTPNFFFDLKNHSITRSDIDLIFKEVKLQLPDIYLTEALPQIGPDSRIQTAAIENNKPSEKVPSPTKAPSLVHLDVKTPLHSPLKISTNLLENALYIDLDMKVSNGSPHGDIQIRPFKTTILKRTIQHKKTSIEFEGGYTPTVHSTLHFPLPNYQIILKLEGPVNEPRPLLSSTPPLPEDDIISVLLFGEPLSALPDDEKASAANQTSHILSQGLLSLSVLYFLSDTPIRSIGIDPETQKISAQISLGQKNSLNLSTQEDGTQSVGVRRSIGKGWFIDTSMQKSTLDAQSDQQNYGVLLERIISY